MAALTKWPAKRTRDDGLGAGEKIAKRRSTIACQACRTAKVKCDVNPYNPPCRRCAESSIPCYLPESRRGRVRGSKNRSTFEQVLPGMPSESGLQDGPGQHDTEGTGTGNITPLDPHNLMKGLDERSLGTSKQLTRRLLHLLGEQFPVGESKDMDTSSAGQGSFQDLLPSITKIAKQGWTLDGCVEARKTQRAAALCKDELPPDDAQLLDMWTPNALQELVSETTRYFEYGLQGSKRDLARDLDPLQRSIVSFQRAHELFNIYFEVVHPQWSMLDHSLHSLDFVRNRSAILTTTILALGSIALATLSDRTHDQVIEAKKLYAHVEKLCLVIYSTGARSIEIIQAQILLSRFGMSSRTRLDEQRWLRSAMIPRMAAEIGLGRRSQPRADANNTDSTETKKQRCNELRTRVFLILNEYRFFSFNGSAPIDLACFELDDSEIQEIAQLSTNYHSASLPALYQLYLFQKELRQRIHSCSTPTRFTTLQLEADLAWISTYTQQWISRWCTENPSHRSRAHLRHDALSCQLLLSARIVGMLPNTADIASHQQRLLDLSLSLFQSALNDPITTHMNSRGSIFPFAGAVILRFGERRDLVLRLALRMVGDPTRPYVPNFVRNAGSQLLAMLCANPPVSKPEAQATSTMQPEGRRGRDKAQRQLHSHDQRDELINQQEFNSNAELQRIQESEPRSIQENLCNGDMLAYEMESNISQTGMQDMDWSTPTPSTSANVPFITQENGSSFFNLD